MENLLANLPDEDLFRAMNQIPIEIKNRIIDLLDSKSITCFTFNCPKESCPIFSVFDYDNGGTEVSVYSVGYSIDQIGNNTFSNKQLYIVDSDYHIWWGDDAILSDQLWDIYSEMKKYFK